MLDVDPVQTMPLIQNPGFEPLADELCRDANHRPRRGVLSGVLDDMSERGRREPRVDLDLTIVLGLDLQSMRFECRSDVGDGGIDHLALG